VSTAVETLGGIAFSAEVKLSAAVFAALAAVVTVFIPPAWAPAAALAMLCPADCPASVTV